jgi:hypothetical protein
VAGDTPRRERGFSGAVGSKEREQARDDGVLSG